MPLRTFVRPFSATRFRHVHVALLVALVMLPSAAFPSEFVVTTTADTADLNPGDGLCADNVGVCSLRAAIQEANASAQPDAITLPAGVYVLGISGADEDFAATGDLDIRYTLHIEGSGADATVIDADHLDRVFDVKSSASTSICQVTIRNGMVADTGGGIRNFGKLTITSTTVVDNSSFWGGGIASIGDLSTLTVIQSSLTSNSASAYKASAGGGIANGTGTLQLDLTTINDNTVVGHGAGISNIGKMTVRNTTISSNQTFSTFEAKFGGGLFNGGPGDGHIENSTINGNTGYNGGGIGNLGSLTLRNVTISGNHGVTAAQPGGEGGDGGGLFNGGVGVVDILNSTIAENTAEGDGDGIHSIAVVTMRNTIMANDCSTLLASQPVTSQGHNIHVDSSCGLAGPDDLLADPKLGALADNSGPTATHALLFGSPAIDTATMCPAIDQRHFIRPSPCDRGAYEKGRVADLAIVKKVDCESVKVGDRLFFTLSALNFGPVASRDVEVVDNLPSGLDFVAARPSQGSCEPAVPLRGGGSFVRCRLGSIPEDGTATVYIEVQAVQPGARINTGTLTSSVTEPELANNTSRVRVFIRDADR